MNVAIEKQRLIDELSVIEDIHLLKAIKELIAYSKNAKTQVALKPFTNRELISRVNKSEEDIKKGRITSLKQVRKEIKSW